jgi:arginine/ornithine N-succinyltransferase beta subunit
LFLGLDLPTRGRDSQALFECFEFCTSSDSLKTVRSVIKDPYAQDLSDADLLKRFYSGTAEEFLDHLAEHIVNGMVELSENYSDSPFWNTHRKRFLGLLWSTEAGYCEMRIKEAAEALLNEGLSFTYLLEDTRKQLSQQQGVPYYQPTTQTESSIY